MRRARLHLLIALPVLLGACTERALDGTGGTTIIIDFGFPSSDGKMAVPVDLASGPTSDLGTSQVGVPCGDETCKTNEICCPLSGRPVGCIPVMGMQGNTCPFSDGWRCDGPEDCADNRVCYGSDFTPTLNGSPSRTRCRPLQMIGGDFRIICRRDADCMPGDGCVPNETTLPFAPSFSTCRGND